MGSRVIPVSFTFALLIVILSTACMRNPFRVDLTGVECNVTVRDLGSEIFDTPPPQLSAKADTLSKTFGRALKVYSNILGLGDPADEKWKSSFILFATDLQNLALWDDVKRVWPSSQPLEEDLESAFRHYLYYFPDAEVPEIVTCMTVFNNSIIIDDSLLMISLDRYLGADSKYYPSLGIYEYQSRKMTPAYAVPDCMYAWATTEWDYSEMGYGPVTLMNTMMHEAKLLYFTRCMIPDLPDTVLYGFRQKQLDFCMENEGMIWEYLVSKDLLFSTDRFLIRKFTGEAPFTSYFTEESPGRAVVWTGYRIIERYMRNNPRVTLAELMKISNFQTVLSGARYNPG